MGCSQVVKAPVSDTGIAGSIAEGVYGVPVNLKEECRKRIPEGFRDVPDRVSEYKAR